MGPPSEIDRLIMSRANEMDPMSMLPKPVPTPNPMVEAMKRAADRVKNLPLGLQFRKGGAMVIAKGKF